MREIFYKERDTGAGRVRYYLLEGMVEDAVSLCLYGVSIRGECGEAAVPSLTVSQTAILSLAERLARNAVLPSELAYAVEDWLAAS